MHIERMSKPAAGVLLFTTEAPAHKAGTKLCSDLGRSAIFQLGTLLSLDTRKPVCLLSSGHQLNEADRRGALSPEAAQAVLSAVLVCPRLKPRTRAALLATTLQDDQETQASDTHLRPSAAPSSGTSGRTPA